ncbi:MAG TPA: amino acid permease [Gammaproteobacteria bacterium]|nr:amino acid permease [Gammaproteobacteria bacterium]
MPAGACTVTGLEQATIGTGRLMKPAAAAGRGAPLGLWTATALVVGNMIGSGLFLLPAALAPFGAAAFLGWGLSAAGAMSLAVVFAWLALRHPVRGGPYAYARLAFGDGAGFLVAWSYWISIWSGNAAIAVAFTGYLGRLVPAFTASPAAAAATALGAVWLCTLTNIAGVRAAGLVQLVTTVLKLLPLATIAVFGVWYVQPADFVPFDRAGLGLWPAASVTAAMTLWAFLGLESATVPAEDVRDAARIVPRATLLGTALAGTATVLACMTVVLRLPAGAPPSAAPFADVAARLWGPAAGTTFGAAAAIACYGALNGWVLLQGQVPLAAARDGLFPALFAWPGNGRAPLAGLLLSSTLASGLVLANYQKDLVGLFTFVLLLATAATLLPFLMCAAAFLKLDRGRGPSHRPAVAAGALVFSVAALLATGAEALAWGTVLVAAGVPLYLWRTARLRRTISPCWSKLRPTHTSVRARACPP